MLTVAASALSCRTDRTDTPLHHAAIDGDFESAACLLQYGAAADLKDGKYAAFFSNRIAASRGRIHFYYTPVYPPSHPPRLIVTPTWTRGCTPLHRALFWGRHRVVR